MRLRGARVALIAVAALAAPCLDLSPGGRLTPVSSTQGQAVVELLPDQPVPAGYQTQSLFLICNPEWLLRERGADLLALHSYFEAFGRAIGRNNAAVWFWQSMPDLDDGLADDVDVERSAELCTQLGLKPSESPHIVFASRWDTDHLVLALGGLGANGIKQVLIRLADKLIAGGIEDKDVQSEVYWQTWYAAAERVLNGLAQIARAVKVSFDTKFFKVELDGSKLVD